MIERQNDSTAQAEWAASQNAAQLAEAESDIDQIIRWHRKQPAPQPGSPAASLPLVISSGI